MRPSGDLSKLQRCYTAISCLDISEKFRLPSFGVLSARHGVATVDIFSAYTSLSADINISGFTVLS